MGATVSQTGITPAMGPSTVAEEVTALQKVMWFSITQLVGVVAGWASSFYLFANLFQNMALFNLPSNPTPEQVSAALGPLIQGLAFVVFLGVAVFLAGAVFLTMGFRQLAKVDRASFSISTPFMAIFMVGLVVVGGSAAFLINSIPRLIANVPPQGGPFSPDFTSVFGSLFADFGLILIGAVLALIGVIGGLILGLWRVGSRYNQTAIKIGAIFEIIPLFNIVAPILILVGANDAKNVLARRG